MKKCSVYVRNATIGPSDYYRIIQYIEDLKDEVEFKIYDAVSERSFQHNINMQTGIVKKVYQAILYIKILVRRYLAICQDFLNVPDCIVIQREIFPKHIPCFARIVLNKLFRKTVVIWDFDDDIFINGEISKNETKLLLENSTNIIGIGTYASGLLPQKYQNKFIAMPTTDKIFSNECIEEIINKRIQTYENEFRIVWVGTASNLCNIDIVINELVKLSIILSNKKCILSVVCNVPYNYKKSKGKLQIQNYKWSRDVAKKQIEKAHLGIMPLQETLYSKGKGGFKLIQYMSSGLPVMASKVGYCEEVIDSKSGYLISMDELNKWSTFIYELALDIHIWHERSLNVYKRYECAYNYKTNLELWKDILRGI